MNEHQSLTPAQLSGHEEMYLREAFIKEMVPKLKAYHARTGTISCGFAGEQYENWMIFFRSAHDDYDIVKFEYYKAGSNMSFDL